MLFSPLQIREAIYTASEAIGRFLPGDILEVRQIEGDCFVFCSTPVIAKLVVGLIDKRRLETSIVNSMESWQIFAGEGALTSRYALRSPSMIEASTNLPTNTIMTTKVIQVASSVSDFLSLDSKFIGKYEERFKNRAGNKYVLDQNDRIIGLMPWMHWAELNRGKDALGQSLNVLDDQIRLPRKAAIERAVVNGGDDLTYYDYIDVGRGLTFSFQMTVEIMPDCDNERLITIVDNPKTEHKLDQRGYWRNWIETQEKIKSSR